MKYFVTGANGYIGSHVVDELISLGHQVVGLTRSEDSAEILRKKGVEPVIGDVKDLELLSKHAKESSGVIHLAFGTNGFADFDAACIRDQDCIRTFHLALKGTGKPIVFTSGTFSFGPSAPGEKADDSSDPKFYRSRSVAEQIAQEFVKEGGHISFVRVDLFLLLSSRPETQVMLPIQTLKKIPGEGNNKIASCHVKDTAHLFVLALLRGKAGYGYNAVNDSEITHKDLATAVGKLVGVDVKSISSVDSGKYFTALNLFFSVNHQASASRAKSELGWTLGNNPSITEDIANGSYRKDLKNEAMEQLTKMADVFSGVLNKK